MNEELMLKLKSNEFDAMWELVSDILLKISGRLNESDNFQKMFSPYILCRYLSMREDLIQYADFLNTVNTNSKLTNEQFYRLAYKLIPKQRSSFIKYIKKPIKSKEKSEEEINNNNVINSSLFDL